MSNKLSSINEQVNTEITEFIEMCNQIDFESLDELSKTEMLATLDDFRTDISNLTSLEDLSQNLEAALQAGLANTLTKDMKLSSEYNMKAKHEAQKIENEKNNTIGYDKLQRD
ncbi:hypothetical protein KW882_02770 [Vibrio parahaemolyticus]